MKKIDLHVHSKYSSQSQNEVIKTLRSKESYVEPEYIYNRALEKGMDFVTITDHDTIEGCLEIKKKYPDKVLMGVETTAYFPEDGCAVHILVYGFTEEQFEVIQKIRTDIYKLRDFLKEEKIAHSVAHATYRLNKKLTLEHIEKLIVLFDVFEGLNGNGNRTINQNFREVLKHLTLEQVNEISIKYNIAPFSSNPAKKGVTAGGDDHSGLFVGSTYTLLAAENLGDISDSIKNKKTDVAGRCQDHKTYAFHIFKIIQDNLADKSGKKSDGLMRQLTEFIFFNAKFNLKNAYKIYTIKKSEKHLYKLLANLINEAEKNHDSLEDRLSAIYHKITDMSDEVIILFAESLLNSYRKGTYKSLLNSIPRILGALIVYGPTMFAIKYMNKDYEFNKSVTERFITNRKNKKKKILWFTDTITDLNGVSVTLRNIGWLASKRGDDVHLVSSMLDEEKTDDLPPNLINLKPLVDTKIPYYENMKLKVPSFFRTIDMLYKYHPDEIYISSPGIVGLYGLLFAKLFGIKCTTIYHTDFTVMLENIISKESPIVTMTEKYTKWFHEISDKILVPSEEYINILARRGFDKAQMDIFHRGIDTEIFKPVKDAKKIINLKYNISDGINLLFAGRISEDKNIDFLIDTVLSNTEKNPEINLIFAGDGPYLPELKEKYKDNKNFYFLGILENKILPELYSAADLLVFPSEMDTFGMVVLESLACGTPAFVSHIGGPSNIVIHEENGYILETDNITLWKEKLGEIVGWIKSKDSRYKNLCQNARMHVLQNYDFEKILDNFVKTNPDTQEHEPTQKLRVVV